MASEHWSRKVYQPLDVATNQVRVLKLQPGSDLNTDPVCNLTVTSLEANNFSCISYVWGSEKTPQHITLNGIQIPIGENAHSALRHVRDPSRETSIWLDAICINQQDIAERSHQVTLMRDLYSQAQTVYLWLGEGPQDSGNVFETAIFQTLRTAARGVRLSGRQYFASLRDKTTYQHAFENILTNSFWQRLWIVQEIFLGARHSNAILQLRRQSIPFRDFRDALVAFVPFISYPKFAAENSDMARFNQAVQSFGRLAILIKGGRGDDSNWHINVLGLIQSMQVKNPRDRVYGFLAVMPDLDIRPDYSRSVGEVYQDATVAHITKHRSLHILMHCNSRCRSSDTGVPVWASSWCPQDSMMPRRWSSLASLYKACGNTPPEITARGKFLVMPAFPLWQIGREDQRGPPFRPNGYEAHPEDASQINGILVGVLAFVKHAFAFWSDDIRTAQYFEDFGRVLLLDASVPSGKQFQEQGRLACRLGSTEHSGTILAEIAEMAYADDFVATDRGLHETQQVTDFNDISMTLVGRLSTFRAAIDPAGRPCIFPEDALDGDSVFVLPGGSVPFVLRPIQGKNAWRVVGPAYVHGMMDGEAVERALLSAMGPWEEMVTLI